MEELRAVHNVAGERAVLSAAREAYDGQMLLLKGPEVAACYPDPALRPSKDLDILVDDAEEAQRALLAAGFEPGGLYGDDYYVGLHHLRPLRIPGQPTPWVEVHRRPSWVKFVDPPATRDLLAAATEGATGVPGVLALPAGHHALALAAHSWSERPMRRLLDLIDIAAVTTRAERAEVHALASRWGLSRLWTTMAAAVDATLFGHGDPWFLRTWARHMQEVRDPAIWENHIGRWMSPFWALPPHRAFVGTATAFRNDITRAPTETWGNKLGRVREAAANPTRPVTKHKRVLGPDGVQPRFKRR